MAVKISLSSSISFLNPLQKTFSVLSTNKKMSSWSCPACTFINPPSQKSTCLICLSPASTPPAKPKWPCTACTLLNPFPSQRCEACGTRAPAASLSTLLDTEDDDDPQSVGTVFLPLRHCQNSGKSAPIEVEDDDTTISDTGYGSGMDTSEESMAGNGGKKRKRLGEQVVVEDDDGVGFRNANTGKNVVIESLDDDIEQAHSSTWLDKRESRALKILTYNVWFREELELHKRMEAISDLIELHSPDIICFQEVTPRIYDIFQGCRWWKVYRCSVPSDLAFSRPYFCMQLTKLSVKNFSCKPFGNSIMGRELCVAEIEVEKEMRLVVATSHLESPSPAPPKWDQMFSEERVAQAKESINLLDQHPNVIFCGDMNWDDKLDGPFPLKDGWVDAWSELRSGEVGYTYDTKTNQMLSGNRSLQKRLDRFLCSLKDFRIHKIEMIGKDQISGLSYCKEKKTRNAVKKLMLPVLPSDHYGLLLEILRL
ncbi:unnamed protein product [Cuscuta epithymum]|uniref:RanBP2-type domain-containing protein n=1 Tax=Cuscuta epithymum TaxID=186058 RepID=A0AAV0CN05_9ASTE|nr:unnamed protein product [Cuscuta epithymum]